MKLTQKFKSLKEYNSVVITFVIFTVISLLIIFLKPFAIKKFYQLSGKEPPKKEVQINQKEEKIFKISSKNGEVVGQMRVFFEEDEENIVVGEYSLLLKDTLKPNGECIDLEGTGCKDNINNVVEVQKIKYRYVLDLTTSDTKESAGSAYIYPVYCNEEKYLSNPANINKIDFSCGLNNVRDWKPTQSFMAFNRLYLTSVEDLKRITILSVYDAAKNYKISTKNVEDQPVAEEVSASYSDAIKDTNKVRSYDITITE